jgi:hypothetical protein
VNVQDSPRVSPRTLPCPINGSCVSSIAVTTVPINPSGLVRGPGGEGIYRAAITGLVGVVEAVSCPAVEMELEAVGVVEDQQPADGGLDHR